MSEKRQIQRVGLGVKIGAVFVLLLLIVLWPSRWGRKIDPETFWRGRVIWDDISAQTAAHLLGRQFPPIPTHKPELIDGFPLATRSQTDIVPGFWSGGLDGGTPPRYHYTDAERAYWNWFWLTKPKPPETLEREQLDAARMLAWRKAASFFNGTNLDNTIPHQSPPRRGFIDPRDIGTPPEALSEQALFWAYVMAERREYAKAQEQESGVSRPGKQSIADILKANVLRGLAVDRKFITEPLTKEQIEAANAWKIAYLRRLHAEKTDESYLKAYMKAWNLDSY